MHSAAPHPEGPPTMPDGLAEALALLRRVSWGRLAMTRQAMPFMAPAGHLVTADGAVLLRLHRALGRPGAYDGGVVAYGADNLGSGDRGSGARALWSAQITGTARLVEPAAAEGAPFGPPPRRADGMPYEPVYLRIDPQFGTVHTLDG
ncbi:pyridoxamine 5'-phosphate oxidase family protein [Streptomyces lichenis]|uniref:Pyridoxamine 5'-phosphate oxidase family protein n=1 Tax=Streptomyces lichenis TaxID=2306967 RepID=A0ABT0I4H0_9ACTN|nr:pyridoxamine 5'-phosphate oxidase family protein [Streptomyces lichenis]MCK8676209.1 pyridoxamine 5'-phosphate oxidase family protein [Streptomyces lichenis]